VPDLVAEVLSPGSPEHDCVRKKQEYARASVLEYWIVNPEGKTLEVYMLQAKQYRLNRAPGVGDQFTSTQLPGFELALADLFAEKE
jgi:Uma2 family endonuclease